ncbi:tRNA (adenosine(37)-N6)-threonylcarbamoyltransferase complex transferase subunit TsaD [Alphaproteobacteria bacterium]|nr:tRNA (adenosine(37)-N6)-threonylcarbamoyltransferase complex transferase subunit TsaD [Alphaproteobacteria bacterium]
MLIFSAETSCDETSVCIMKEDKTILSHIVYSQTVHTKHGGVVPELASRAHLEILQQITKEALKESGVKLNDINLFSATCGPGLIGGLLIGSTFTKSLSIGNGKPFIPINHLEAHILSSFYNNEIKFPHLSLLITGGHTQIYFLESYNNIKLIGETIDDAIGEAFDKVAKILGLSYPGGPEIEKKALEGNEESFKLPQPLINEDNSNFSFSGLKTSVNLIAKKNIIDESFIKNMSASFQKCVGDILTFKLNRVIRELYENNTKDLSISVVGGVANNDYLKKCFKNIEKKETIKFVYPPKYMMNDNAAMIAWATILKHRNNHDLNFKPNPRLIVE